MSAFVRVFLDQASGGPLDYAVPEPLRGNIAIGSRVRVPLRTRMLLATVIQLLETSEVRGVRDIAGLVDDKPLVKTALLDLAEWMADYYCCPIETALRSVLPQVVRDSQIGAKTRYMIRQLRQPTGIEMETLSKRSARQGDALRTIQDAGGVLLLARATESAGVTESVFRSLEKRGWITIEKETVARDPHAGETFLASPELILNEEQAVALTEVCRAVDEPQAAKPILLFGVTGSGKTEIYLRAIRHVINQGKTALVLVPEISLTPQTVERFKTRFSEMQEQVAVLHSHLSAGERYDEWYKIHSAAARIVIGARSSVFAPLDAPGLIIVDEEHENSYKQEESPRYHARDVAVMRAHREGCAILLGSATPSLESWQNVRAGKYQLLELKQRVDNRSMPVIRVLDMRRQARAGADTGILSLPLRNAIEQRMTRGEQTILFLNRRGFSTSMLCGVCGYVCECPNCSVALTYHREAARLACHICGHSARAPKECPKCHDPGIRHTGTGTQKVEEAVQRVFPKARVARMDADSMTRKEAYRETLGAFKAGNVDILVGTQMIAKGLHFPNVTLVGIINADQGLHLPDFRAGERTFQLLTQVAGRAGRGEMEGEVFVQTTTPFSPSIQFARHHDYEGYMDQELEFRQSFGFPPFNRMALITLRCTMRERAEFAAQTLVRRLKEVAAPGDVIGEAMPAPLEKARGFYRFHVSLRGASAIKISRYIRATLERLPMQEDVVVAVDIDPLHLL